MGQAKWSTIVVTAVIVVVMAGGGVYLWQNKKAQPTSTQKVNQEQETRLLADCSELDSSWTLFSDSGPSLSFCYKTSWGTPEFKETGISPKARKGTVYHISFPKSANYYPLISYSTLDFQKLGDSDGGPGIDWKALTSNKNEVELARLFPNDNATAQKLTMNGKQVLKINRDFVEPLSQERITPLDYFMPNVVISGTTYNLHIIGSPEQEADLEKLLNSIVF